MSIRISNTSIHFGNFTLTANTEGFSFDGKIRAKRGFISSRPIFQGTLRGYSSGGFSYNPPAGLEASIQRYPFASDTNATDTTGDLTQSRKEFTSQSSQTHGYNSGGETAPGGTSNVIDKFPFAVDAGASDVGDLTQARRAMTGGGQSSSVNGYASGGFAPPQVNVIDKFPFATDTNASDVGDLTLARFRGCGNSSKAHGYTSGGQDPSQVNTIDKFPFATDANATDVGDLSTPVAEATGQSSETNGYVSKNTVIDKFSFVSDSNASDIGNLSQTRNAGQGSSSTTHGYFAGGNDPGLTPNGSNVIDKFSFSIDSDATDVGDLAIDQSFGGGQQV